MHAKACVPRHMHAHTPPATTKTINKIRELMSMILFLPISYSLKNLVHLCSNNKMTPKPGKFVRNKLLPIVTEARKLKTKWAYEVCSLYPR